MRASDIPIDHPDWPPPLKDSKGVPHLGYEFFEVPPGTQTPMPLGFPLPDITDAKFSQKIAPIADDIARRLGQIETEEQLRDPAPVARKEPQQLVSTPGGLTGSSTR